MPPVEQHTIAALSSRGYQTYSAGYYPPASGLDRELTRESEVVARSRAYPSPPMSGSSPSPQKAAREANDRGHPSVGYPTTFTAQDPYRGTPTLHSPSSLSSHPSEAFARSYPSQPIERTAYSYQQTHDFSSRPLPYPTTHIGNSSHIHGPTQQSYLPIGGHSTQTGYPLTNVSSGESQALTSPKSQRKAKGHVASACVPCKRAHLRCDAQRPCSRCTSNGKEDACVDVQHKKRGRPRLRDDREARYDVSRPPPPHDLGMRRPLNIYPSGSGGGPIHELSFRSDDPYRVTKPHHPEMQAPRYIERASGSDANVYGSPSSVVTRQAEPVAYLTMDLEFARVSDTFMEALAGSRLDRRRLSEIVISTERDKVQDFQQRLLAEQKQMEPNYLPPILGRGEQVFQSLGFTADEVVRFRPRQQEFLGFVGGDGHVRQYPIRIGLAKEGSFFFVVLVLALPPRPPYLGASPHDRPAPGAYYAQTHPLHVSQNQHPAAPFESRGHASSEVAFHHRDLGGQTRPSQSTMSPSISPGGAMYAASQSRIDQPSSFSYTPRSEMPQGSQPRRQSFQLPPIRSPRQEEGAEEQTWHQREERKSRVDIGGLIEKPEGSGRPH